MTKLLKLVDAPTLPYDVLRLVFEEATRSDRRKATKYTLVSKLIRHWVENYLYSDVQLYSEKSVRKFLRTLESSTKSKFFFSTHIQSLTIAYDVRDFEWTARILSFCSGVDTLTVWAIPSHRIQDRHPIPVISNPPYPTRHPYDLPQFILPRHHLYDHYNSLYDAFANYLRPKHLAVLIDKPLYIQRMPFPAHPGLAPVMSPDFSLGLFSNLTHLSIVNRWTEWSAWSWSWSAASPDAATGAPSALNFLPKLTHLSLEIQVGKRLPVSKVLSPSLTSASPPSRRNQKLAEHVGLSLSTILTSPELIPHLCVLLCVLSFDEEPHCTAQAIREETARNLAMVRTEQKLHSFPTPQFALGFPLNSTAGDPRLVFAYDRTPFSEREAGSPKVWDMWRSAEEIMRLQWRDHGTGAIHDPIVFKL